LSYSVDVLTKPEPVESASQLDPKKYGAIVESGRRRGLLLPDLEGVDTVEEQIDICRQKAGIPPQEPVKLYRFQVKRYSVV
jgi:AMMECR1 domain-containing protein